MSSAIIDTSILAEIADAVRDKTGETAPIKLGEMAQAIESIQGGGDDGGELLKKIVGQQSSSQRYDITEKDLSGITSIRQYAFRGCSYLNSVSVPEGVTSLASYAFYASGITQISLPSTLESVGGSVIYNCTSLQTITCRAVTPPSLSASNSIQTSNALKDIYVPAGSVDAYKNATNWSSHSSKIKPIP